MKKLLLSVLLIIGIFSFGVPAEVRAEKKTYPGISELPSDPGSNKGGETGYETAGGMKDKVKAFQIWYNSNCLKEGEGKLDIDGLYGPLTHDAKVKAKNGCGEEEKKEEPKKEPKKEEKKEEPKKETIGCLSDFSSGYFPPVMHGCVLPGPTSSQEGVDYVSGSLLPAIASTLLVFILSVAVAVIVIGGIIYIFSSGNTELTGKARDAIMWAIVGSAVAILAYTIVKFIIGINFLG